MKKVWAGYFAAAILALCAVPVYADDYTPEGYRIVGEGVDYMSSGEAGWVQVLNSWRYRDGHGSFLTSRWEYLDGIWYRFNEYGYMQTGFYDENGITYYLKPDGAMACNETLILNDGQWYFNADGAGSLLGSAEGENVQVPAAWPYKQITPVPPENEKSEEYHALDQVCDGILAAITTPEMSKRQKAERIYAYVRGNFTYAGHSRTRDWVHEAYQGLRANHGDCYTYYAAAQALLIRAGIRCIEVIRNTDNDHFWELVELEDGWWHFDTTPRRVGGYYCLWSDAQMDAFSAQHGGCFAFDHSLYPPTP